MHYRACCKIVKPKAWKLKGIKIYLRPFKKTKKHKAAARKGQKGIKKRPVFRNSKKQKTVTK